MIILGREVLRCLQRLLHLLRVSVNAHGFKITDGIQWAIALE
jgi:hypothetical protein